MTNPLAPIMEWYEVALDSMKVSTRVITKDIRGAVTKRHVFHGEAREQSLRRIARAEGELSDLVVLSLVATFERTLRDFMVSRSGRLLEGGDPVDLALHAAVISDIEYWRIADRLIVIFKDHVEPDHLGRVKQIIGYRNWVAHGRATKEPPDGNVTPRVAFEQLAGFLSKAGIIDS
jgi:hypothetical protein